MVAGSASRPTASSLLGECRKSGSLVPKLCLGTRSWKLRFGCSCVARRRLSTRTRNGVSPPCVPKREFGVELRCARSARRRQTPPASCRVRSSAPGPKPPADGGKVPGLLQGGGALGGVFDDVYHVAKVHNLGRVAGCVRMVSRIPPGTGKTFGSEQRHLLSAAAASRRCAGALHKGIISAS